MLGHKLAIPMERFIPVPQQFKSASFFDKSILINELKSNPTMSLYIPKKPHAALKCFAMDVLNSITANGFYEILRHIDDLLKTCVLQARAKIATQFPWANPRISTQIFGKALC